MKREVRKALRGVTANKASGIDELPVEIIKAAGEAAITALTSICQQIWKSNLWPKEWRRSLFLPLPKKLCSNYRTIALNPHASKILTYLLTPWCRVLLEKLTGLQLVKRFPAFHGT